MIIVSNLEILLFNSLIDSTNKPTKILYDIYLKLSNSLTPTASGINNSTSWAFI